MKVAILTFHNEDNYGALLQAYSLQQTLLKMGVNSQFIEIEPKHPDEVNKEEKTTNGPMNFFANKLQIENSKRGVLFEAFREAHLHRSKSYTSEELEKLSDNYECFIVGSDQVWNFYSPVVDYRYVLPFVPKEKSYSYAASFGTDRVPDKLRGQLSEAFQNFQMISVREESGREIIRDLTGREAVVCLDPSLLMSAADFEKIEEGQEIDAQYVLLFILSYDEVLVEKAKKYAIEHGLQLKTITACFMPQFGFEAWNQTGEEQWIYLIHHAQAVFTNSFHGTVLSLMFGKIFMVAGLKGALEKRNGRIYELLKMVDAEGSLEEPISIGVEVFQEKIQQRKKISMNYLKKVQDCHE